MRASAAAIFSLTGTGVGSALGPLVVGYLSRFFAEAYGDDSVRWGLVWLSLGFVLSAIACVFAARTVRDDLSRARAAQEADARTAD